MRSPIVCVYIGLTAYIQYSSLFGIHQPSFISKLTKLITKPCIDFKLTRKSRSSSEKSLPISDLQKHVARSKSAPLFVHFQF